MQFPLSHILVDESRPATHLSPLLPFLSSSVFLSVIFSTRIAGKQLIKRKERRISQKKYTKRFGRGKERVRTDFNYCVLEADATRSM
jgi:hypothetical protein